MADSVRPPFEDLDEQSALRAIVEGTATETGMPFFRALVRNLAQVLSVRGAWVTEYLETERRLRALAFWLGRDWVQHFEYDIAGTPCEPVIDSCSMVHIPDRVVELYPDDPDLPEMGAVSYLGIALTDLDGTILGHLAVLDTRALPEQPRIEALFRIFANRATAELRRLRAESALREREEKLGRLVSTAMDAIVELDGDLQVTQMNPAAEQIFGCREGDVVRHDFSRFLSPEAQQQIHLLCAELATLARGQRSRWIPGGLAALRADGSPFPAEATLSATETSGPPFYTLILRDVNERREAERRIRSLTDEALYLREEIRSLHGFDEIVGDSAALQQVLRDVQQVADTEATVLIHGETGTGKELIARAIHALSQRAEKPLIKVNCAALPSTLIESEFFGHERGAFTGATQKRDGRFLLADHGTIFLDEIGELPQGLQAKLLRVLQEGEFEPVGSSRTRTVDVRVIAATNRNLQDAVEAGEFRSDLFYRLNVFPIRIPPLRERAGDVPELARRFAERFAQQTGRQMEPLSPEALSRLEAYPWPGNVRELQNVIERGVITARDGRLNLDRALPEISPAFTAAALAKPDGDRVHTAREMQALERENLIRALQRCDWKVAGDGGAAKLLDMKPSTLTSRMKALGIRRPS